MGSSGECQNAQNHQKQRFFTIFDLFSGFFAPNYLLLCPCDLEITFSNNFRGPRGRKGLKGVFSLQNPSKMAKIVKNVHFGHFEGF